MPLVCAYYTLTSSVFLNVSTQNAQGLESLANSLLNPVHYVFAAQEAIRTEDGNWQFVQKFDYSRDFWIKTTTSLIALPPSLILGSTVKGLSLLDKATRSKYFSLIEAKSSTRVKVNNEMYAQMGLIIGEITETLKHQGFERKQGDENALAVDKKALKDIAEALNQSNISWWVDCGTCLGAYRYGGVIPWDGDIDIAVLQPDFENVRRVLNKLPKEKYLVQNWSSREYPNSWIKVYIRESGTMIDVYHFRILPETKEISFIFAYDNHLFFPEWWKVRERRFKVPIRFDLVFPLKKADLDGIEIFVPNQTEKYLNRYYGENLDPVKIYNPETGIYEKDLSHPYWQRAYVH